MILISNALVTIQFFPERMIFDLFENVHFMKFRFESFPTVLRHGRCLSGHPVRAAACGRGEIQGGDRASLPKLTSFIFVFFLTSSDDYKISLIVEATSFFLCVQVEMTVREDLDMLILATPPDLSLYFRSGRAVLQVSFVFKNELRVSESNRLIEIIFPIDEINNEDNSTLQTPLPPAIASLPATSKDG